MATSSRVACADSTSVLTLHSVAQLTCSGPDDHRGTAPVIEKKPLTRQEHAVSGPGPHRLPDVRVTDGAPDRASASSPASSSVRSCHVTGFPSEHRLGVR